MLQGPGTGSAAPHGSRERSQARPPDTWTPRRFDHASRRTSGRRTTGSLRSCKAPPHRAPAAPIMPGPRISAHPRRPDRRPAAAPRRPDRRRAAIPRPPRRRYSRQGRKEKKYFNFLIDAPPGRNGERFSILIWKSRQAPSEKLKKG